jgi:hypothetical protein
MNLKTRSLLAFAIAGGLVAVPLGNSMAALPVGAAAQDRRLDDDEHHHDDDHHHRFEHMHKALVSLREGRKQLEDAEDVFKGHREEALDHVDHAIKQVEDGLREQGEKIDDVAVTPAKTPLDDERFPHLRRALDRLHDAREQLQAAEDVFKGHRDEALEQTNKAIQQIEEAMEAR